MTIISLHHPSTEQNPFAKAPDNATTTSINLRGLSTPPTRDLCTEQRDIQRKHSIEPSAVRCHYDDTMENPQTMLDHEPRTSPCRNTAASKTAKKKSTSLPTETVEYLKAWMMSPEHIAHPYPTEIEKAQIMKDTNIEMKQLTNWFVNNRKRYWKPRVEARLRESKQEAEVLTSPPIIKRDGSVLSLKDFLAVKGTSPEDSSSPAPKANRRRSARASACTMSVGPVASPLRVISEQNSVVSASDSGASSDDEDSATGQEQEQMHEFHTESVNVHITRPSGDATPQLCDVSIEDEIASSQVLRTFKDCAVTFRVDNSKTCSFQRQNEIDRIKKHYLRLYLAENVCLPSSSPSPETRKRVVEASSPPRTKYRRVCVETWKQACQSAAHIYDQDLPSFEEASQLFGFAP